MKKPKLIRPTKAENARINAGIVADPDTRELSDEEFAELRPPRGRPKAASKKVAISVRLDPDVLEALRATGEGWQRRINVALRRAFVGQGTKVRAGASPATRRRSRKAG
jgi:uncharacterized protein (DUF4415 family)